MEQNFIETITHPIIKLMIDDTDFALVDEDILEACENDAADTINNYLRGLETTIPIPVADLTAEIIAIDAHLTKCNLWRRRDYEPEPVTALRIEMHDRLRRMVRTYEEVRASKFGKNPPVR